VGGCNLTLPERRSLSTAPWDLNNRAENSHQPTRRRELIMKRFKSARQAQRFLSVHDQVANLFHIPYPKSAPADFRRASRRRAFATCARSPRRALLPDPASQKNRLSSARHSLKLTMPSEEHDENKTVSIKNSSH
jgi:hypothetical protein